jgi:hypothetical protein
VDILAYWLCTLLDESNVITRLKTRFDETEQLVTSLVDEGEGECVWRSYKPPMAAVLAGNPAPNMKPEW